MGAEFRVLGPVEVLYDGRSLPVAAHKQRVLLATLLLRANRAVPVEQLAARVWHDDADLTGRTRATLQTYLMRLRQRLAPLDVIRTTDSGYLIKVEPELVDVERFRRAAESGRAALAGGDLEAASSAFSVALGEWRGSALSNVDSERVRLDELPGLLEEKSLAQEQWVDARLALGEHADVLAELTLLAKEHPLRERLWASLMLALCRCGRRVEALDTYQRLRKRLLEELGVSPSRQLQDLYQRILASDPELDLAAGRRPARLTLGRRLPPRPPRQLPLDVVGFTGRDRELRELDGLLADSDADVTAARTSITTVDGSPGVGKTALAVRWAHRVADHFPDGQLYLDLGGYGPDEPIAPARALETLLLGLGVPAERIPPDQDARSALFRSELADRRLLVVLDNARNAGQVRPLLPGSGRAVVLVTSRSQLRGLTVLHGAPRITVEELTSSAAMDLLAGLIGPERVEAEPDAARSLVRLSARLPLALRILAERIARVPAIPLIRLAEELRGHDARLAGFDPVDQDGEAAASLRTAFDRSYATLSPSAARLFRLLGLHPARDISVSAAAALAGVRTGEAAGLLDALAAAHLVEQHRFGWYTSHDLLRAYAAEKAEIDEPSVTLRQLGRIS